jgi:hypothetical protein
MYICLPQKPCADVAYVVIQGDVIIKRAVQKRKKPEELLIINKLRMRNVYH